MSDFKSKLPDFNELTSMAGKLFKDVKDSVCEIVDMYKQKREHIDVDSQAEKTTTETKTVRKTTAVKKEASREKE